MEIFSTFSLITVELNIGRHFKHYLYKVFESVPPYDNRLGSKLLGVALNFLFCFIYFDSIAVMY